MEKLKQSNEAKRDMKGSFPPLLRGIGTVVILMAAVIAFCIARRHDQAHLALVSANQSTTGKGGGNSPASSQDSVVEEVLENDWVEWLGFTGTAIFGASFFVEAYVRYHKTT
jgi:hypothetical protein